MTKDIAICFADDNLAEAERVMMARHVRRLPVMERLSHKLAGVISVDDIAIWASRQRAGAVVEEAAKHSAPASTSAGLPA